MSNLGLWCSGRHEGLKNPCPSGLVGFESHLPYALISFTKWEMLKIV